MISCRGRRCCGFTLAECAVAAGLLGIFVALLVGRVQGYHHEAERVAAEQLVGTLRTALQVRATRAVIERGEHGLAALLDQNPLDWLSQKPSNYLGEYYAPDMEELPSGNWFFDRADKSLVYLMGNTKTFTSQTSNFLKFKVKLFRLPSTDRNGRPSTTNSGLVFDQVFDRNAVNNDEKAVFVPH
jgi:type II secretory pathway pseudopilin PulG